MSLLYLRYIDDIFMVWKVTNAELKTFIKICKWKRQNYQIGLSSFTKKNCCNDAMILDAMLYKDENINIQTTW